MISPECPLTQEFAPAIPVPRRRPEGRPRARLSAILDICGRFFRNGRRLRLLRVDQPHLLPVQVRQAGGCQPQTSATCD
jgi:hypothetical protein